jgi:hypothetical protein
LSLFDSTHKEVLDVAMAKLLMIYLTVPDLHKLVIVSINESLSTWLGFTTTSRFHCALCISIVVFSLFKENNAVIRICNSSFSEPGKDPWSKHAVTTAIVNFNSNIGIL